MIIKQTTHNSRDDCDCYEVVLTNTSHAVNFVYFILHSIVVKAPLTVFMLAPIDTYIHVSDLTPYQWVSVVFYLHQSAAFTHPFVMSAMLCIIFCIQFRLVDEQLLEAIKKPDWNN